MRCRSCFVSETRRPAWTSCLSFFRGERGRRAAPSSLRHEKIGRLLDPSRNLRLLVVRLGAMGDILHSLPAVTALRLAHPEWFIGWAVEPQWQGLFRSGDAEPGSPRMPLVNQLHIVPAKKWARSPLSGTTWSDMGCVRQELRE